MWIKAFVLLSIVAAGVICTNLEDIFTSTFFHRDPGYALIGHVIMTLPVFIADCMLACQEMLSCFSYNYIDFHNGTFLCELNWSNKKQSSSSFKHKEGYEYAELANAQYCDGNSCTVKDALPDSWYMFNESLFKLILDKKTWNDARTHCQSLGGDLASISSKIEELFIDEVVLFPLQGLLSWYEMNGSDDPSLRLQNGAAVVDIDGTKAVHFDGANDYATIPSFNIRDTDFTIALWIKSGKFGFVNTVLNDRKDSDSNMAFNVYFYYGQISFNAWSFEQKSSIIGCFIPSGEFPLHKWTHLTITWDRSAKECKMYLNSVHKSSKISPAAVHDIHKTGYTTFELAASDGIKHFKGWMRQFTVFSYIYPQQDIRGLLDFPPFGGAWMGLNDNNQEGVIQWSDNQPLTYTPIVESNSPSLQCGFLKKITEYGTTWLFKDCSAVFPFICEKR